MADAFIIETAELRKSYDGVEALRGLSLKVPAGSIYGFLGRNGAGKTTTVKVVLGMARPTSGYARVFGLAADAPDATVEIRRRTGFVSEDKDLYGHMTVEGIIRFTAAFYPRGPPRSGRTPGSALSRAQLALDSSRAVLRICLSDLNVDSRLHRPLSASSRVSAVNLARTLDDMTGGGNRHARLYRELQLSCSLRLRAAPGSLEPQTQSL